jgi:hypothetical protein
MKASGAGNTFNYSGRHANCVVNAVRNRDNPNCPFRGFPIDQVKPEIGDLICAPREGNRKLNYSQIVKTGDFGSHYEIAIAKKDSNSIEGVGGNVGLS